MCHFYPVSFPCFLCIPLFTFSSSPTMISTIFPFLPYASTPCIYNLFFSDHISAISYLFFALLHFRFPFGIRHRCQFHSDWMRHRVGEDTIIITTTTTSPNHHKLDIVTSCTANRYLYAQIYMISIQICMSNKQVLSRGRRPSNLRLKGVNDRGPW